MAWTQRRRVAPRSRRRRRSQRGGRLFDVQKLLTKTGMEFHWPGYQYIGPGTHLEKRLPAVIQASTDYTGLPKPMTLTMARLKT